MIISMQGNWKVAVKSKSAAFPQRFVVQGASSGNGVYAGSSGTYVYVSGTQWSIAIQHNPGSGWQISDTKIMTPVQSGGKYVFDIHSNDTGTDTDFNDLILTCSTSATINDFIIYGNVMLYSKSCIFNPCRVRPAVIDTFYGLLAALKNDKLRQMIEKYYPERIPPIGPNPPDPPPLFRPMVFDFLGEATQPRTVLTYSRKEADTKKKETKSSEEPAVEYGVSDYNLLSRSSVGGAGKVLLTKEHIDYSKIIGKLYHPCTTEAGKNLTLTFEEYDRTPDELGGGSYTGEGDRRLLGNCVTDMFGNYIFRFKFDMTFPGLEDSTDIAPGEDVNVVMYPDVIVKVVGYSPIQVHYESAPYYNIPNLKKINLCLPEDKVQISSQCFNGNLIGSLGNVFLGGYQNSGGSLAAADLKRHGDSNYLEPNGVISVNSPLAGFSIECAAWAGTIDIKGCMYDMLKSASDNKIKWYTLRIKRDDPAAAWQFISQNYRHPKFSKRNLPGYIGDVVGPFYPNPGGILDGSIPAYINIQREIMADGVDWEWSNFDRYMQLSTALYDYDAIAGARKPGTFYFRVDGYDEHGVHVPGATDLIALFIHNNGLNFEMTNPILGDPLIAYADCGLYRLTDAQMKTPMLFAFEANDPYGFVNSYTLTMGRCPVNALNLKANIEADPLTNPEGAFAISGSHLFPGGTKSGNVHHICPGYKGTQDDFSNPGMVDVQIQPMAVGDGWIKPGEYFTIYSFALLARQRITNGYNSGVSSEYHTYSQIMMERLNP